MNTGPTSIQRLLAHADLLLVLRDLFGSADRALETLGLFRGDGLSTVISGAGALVAPPRLPAIDDAEFRRQHSALFEGAEACPLNESAYVRRDKGAILADLCGFYRAFGFEPSDGVGERVDHLTFELEFAAVLLVLIAGAAERNEQEHFEIAGNALSSFAQDHLGEWLPSAAARLAEVGAGSVYALFSVLLLDAWRSLLSNLGLPGLAERPAASPPMMEEGTPYECGMISDPVEAVDLTVGGQSIPRAPVEPAP
jgi:TorA maturation chaperone TorD